MDEIVSRIKNERKNGSFDIIFNKDYLSRLDKGEEISYWNGKYNFLKGRKYSKYYPKGDIFSRPEFNSTVVVGNSGSLLGLEVGEYIDKHDCIIRFNTAPVEGYEEYVGSTTDYRISIGTITYRSGTENILRTYRRKVQPKRDYKNELFSKDYHYVFTHEFIRWVQDFKEKKKRKRNVCSSGFVGVMLALLISEKVTICGFNLPSHENDYGYHYYNEVQYSERSHNFENEHEIYRNLEEKIDEFKWIKN